MKYNAIAVLDYQLTICNSRQYNLMPHTRWQRDVNFTKGFKTGYAYNHY